MTQQFYGEPIFTDAIKDVIGRAPVLDQFDISYEASYYGSMQYDFVTGSMLSIISPDKYSTFNVTGSKGDFAFLTGTRGRYFSKWYSRAAQVYSETPLSPGTEINPYLSFRQIQPFTRAGRTSYKFSQHYDSQERYYDSCIPKFNKCLAANGTSIWTLNQENLLLLSPYGNFPISDIGFITFNNPYVADRTSQGYSVDPLTDNTWTWSFPFENRYDPTDRVVQNTISMNIKESNLESNLLLNNLNVSQTSKNVKGIVPILFGKLQPDDMFPGGRNSQRIAVVSTASNGINVFFSAPATQQDPRGDGRFGYSILFPSDVYLNAMTDHGYIDIYNADFGTSISKPAPDPVTGTMNFSDTVKFLFGFGDMNNMWYGYSKLDLTNFTSSMYGFEDITSAPSGAHEIPSPQYLVQNAGGYIGNVVEFNWAASPKTGSTGKGWWVSGSTKENVSATGYNFIGEIIPPLPPFVPAFYNGIIWPSSSSPSNNYVLRSDTDIANGGNMVDDSKINFAIFAPWSASLGWDMSIAAVDITSSIPWTLRYKRGVIANATDGLLTYFSAIPGRPPYSSFFGDYTYFPFFPIEFVRGKSKIDLDPLAGVSYMEQFDLRNQGSPDSFPQQVINLEPGIQNSWVPFEAPLNPGSYRLCFAYIKSGSSLAGSYSTPDFAAIDDIEVVYWPTGSYSHATDLPKMGANNYPHFRKNVGDTRYQPLVYPNPIAWPFYEPSIVSGTADIYKSYDFGVSPVIRGWKYGLSSGFPQNSKAVYRHGKFGQFRDMLEQRQYAKFIITDRSPIDGDAITRNGRLSDSGDVDPTSYTITSVNQSPVSVIFVEQTLSVDNRGIGDIITTEIEPESTESQNLSYECTSSLPYFDGIARNRGTSLPTYVTLL